MNDTHAVVSNALASPFNGRHGQSHHGGFTLIELLVAVSVMSVLAVLSWRGLDVMTRAQAQTSLRVDQVLTLQAGLSQWRVDLDAVTSIPQINPLDWDGRTLRLTRRTATPGDGVMVVAWMRRTDAAGQWVRWQSPVLRTSVSWHEAWSRAEQWAQSTQPDNSSDGTSITPLDEWQIFYFRGNAWTNPMSNAYKPVANNSPALVPQPVSHVALPDGIRLVLTLPSSQAISGKLTVDWVSPTLGAEKS